jgi:DNA repair protein RadC
MAAVESTPKPRPTRRRAVMASDCIPAYGAGAGVLSFRHGLPANECRAIDRALEIVGRCLRQPGVVMTDPDAVKQYIRLHIGGETTEIFCVMYLDTQNRVIAFDHLFTGTLTQTNVYPREVVRAALAHGANAVILTHNHPTGITTPSRADRALTQTLKDALALVDVRVLDHVIVGGDRAESMAEKGLL